MEYIFDEKSILNFAYGLVKRFSHDFAKKSEIDSMDAKFDFLRDELYTLLDNAGLLHITVNGQPAIVENGKLVITIPTTTSELRNDSDYFNGSQVRKSIQDALPTKLSQLANDCDFQNSDQVNKTIQDNKITKISELINDKDYQTGEEVRKSINNALPTRLSELTNDCDYKNGSEISRMIDAQGGKIDIIKVNGTKLNISSDKSVDITVPTKVSQVTNDKNYQDNDQVSSTVNAAIEEAVNTVMGSTY